MGSLIAFVGPDLSPASMPDLGQTGIGTTRWLKDCSPPSVIRNEWSCVASCKRWNGSGSPLVSDDRGSWLAAAGTYFHESGDSRPEHLLEEYLCHGAERLGLDLNGFFVIIVGDGRTRKLTVITDLIGSCHVYARHLDQITAVATSSQALARLADVSLDPVACQEFLATGVMYEDRTFYRQVRKLPPATITTFGPQRQVRQRKYWDIGKLCSTVLTENDAVERLWGSLTFAANTVAKRFNSIACDLTGGYDSRCIVAAFSGVGAGICAVVSGPAESADVRVSRGLAAMLNIEHLHCPPDNTVTSKDIVTSLRLTDGEYDLVEYANIARIHRRLAERFQISINGSFGEVARGYWWELLLPRTGAVNKLDASKLARARYAVGSCSNLIQPQFRIDLVEHMAAIIERTIGWLAGTRNTFQMDLAYLRMRMQRWQGRIASSTNQIWPCLSPFMFRAPLETMLQTDPMVRRRSLLVRQMLSRFQPRIAAFPLEHGYPAESANWRNIGSFWPVIPHYAGRIAAKLSRRLRPGVLNSGGEQHLRLRGAEPIQELFNPEFMQSATVLDPAAIRSFLESSRHPGFSSVAHWNRLLSLELAARCATSSDVLEQFAPIQANSRSIGGW